jgi:hypothetical protein
MRVGEFDPIAIGFESELRVHGCSYLYKYNGINYIEIRPLDMPLNLLKGTLIKDK